MTLPRRLLFASMAIALTLGAAEVVARLLPAGMGPEPGDGAALQFAGNPELQEGNARFWTPDPFLFWRMRPDLNVDFGGMPLRTNAGGFESSAISLLQRCIDKGGNLVIYGHPHSCSDPTSPQRFEALERFLQVVDEQRRLDNIRCLLPRDILQESVHE